MILKSLFGLVFLIVSAQAKLTPVYAPEGEEINQKEPRHIGGGRNRYVTETVYGFLDFTTTVGSTVMVFTPQSEIASNPSSAVTSPVPVAASSAIVSNPQALSSAPTEKSKRRTTNQPTGLAKLLQEALLLKHVKKEKKKTTPPPVFERVMLTSVSPRLEPSIYVPEEAVVSAGQQLPSLSVLGPFKTKINNILDNDLRYDYAISEPRPSANADYALVDIKSGKPTGLVTTLGGTIIADGQTTIHQTSVIGTYVGGQYAQVLKSTSKIFNATPVRPVVSPTPEPTYKTVKAVIKGSATQFFSPEPSAIFPIASANPKNRSPRYKEDFEGKESSLSKRRGSNYYNDYYDTQPRGDQYYDEYEDLQRAGSGLRASFQSTNAYVSQVQPSKTKAQTPQLSTFRHRYKQGATRNTPPSFLRNSPPPDHFNRDRDRFRLSAGTRFQQKQQAAPIVRPLNNTPRRKQNRPIQKNRLVTQTEQASEAIITNIKPKQKQNIEETVRVVTSRPVDGPSGIWYEIIILKSLHTYRIGSKKNTRYLTYTTTSTHTIEPTSEVQIVASEQLSYENLPLFENILNKPKEISTLPPINIEGQDLNALMYMTTETFKTVETMYKTSVLPVQQNGHMDYYTLTQTFYISRIVTAVKTVPPFEAFIPSNSLNEFNDKLLAEGTENEHSLLPGEKEYDENGEIRVRPPPGFKESDANLAELAGGKFNPDALEKQMNPQLAAAIQNHKSAADQTPALSGTKSEIQTATPASATPAMSPEALQLAYLRLMNPYMFGGLPGAQQTTVTSYPIVVTTDVTTTATRVLRVILNARPIMTTISSTAVVRTTITSYSTATVTVAPSLPGLGGFPFGAAPLPFPGG